MQLRRLRSKSHSNWSGCAGGHLRRGGDIGRFTVPLQEAVEHLAVAELELAAHDARVVHAQDGVDVLHALRADVGELLDLRRRVLDLVVRHLQPELLDPRLDRVPAGQPVAACASVSVMRGDVCVGGGETETHPMET